MIGLPDPPLAEPVHGVEVHDLGFDVDPLDFVKKAEDEVVTMGVEFPY